MANANRLHDITMQEATNTVPFASEEIKSRTNFACWEPLTKVPSKNDADLNGCVEVCYKTDKGQITRKLELFGDYPFWHPPEFKLTPFCWKPFEAPTLPILTPERESFEKWIEDNMGDIRLPRIKEQIWGFWLSHHLLVRNSEG